jgi:V/A-type H+-transporting ATPase subunit A
MSEARITWISGPVLRAATEDVFHINEAVIVGHKRLLGEIIRIEQNAIVAQAYEDTSGLRPGDTVLGYGTRAASAPHPRHWRLCATWHAGTPTANL